MSDSPSPSPSADRAAVIADLEPAIGPGRILAIGEHLGTNEFPALIGELTDVAIARSLDVVVGLELPMSEEPTSGVFGSFWTRAAEFRDGRSSDAMARLVNHLVERMAEPTPERGRVRDIVAMDGPWVAPGSPVPLHLMDQLERPRDVTMADRLLQAMDRWPKAFTIVLADAAHTRSLRSPAPTLGSIVASWHPRTLCLAGQATGGEAWMLTGDERPDGPYPVATIDVAAGALWAPEPGLDGHHGSLTIGSVTPSPPYQARGGATAPPGEGS